jgi:hypothetical protein
VGLDGVPVRPAECGVHVEHGLHVVLSGRDLRDTLQRKAPCIDIDHGGAAGTQPVHVDAVDRYGREAAQPLKARLDVVRPRDEKQDPAVYRLLHEVLGNGHLKAETVGRRRTGGENEEKGSCGGDLGKLEHGAPSAGRT